MKKAVLVLALALAGCLPWETKETLKTREQAVAAARQKVQDAPTEEAKAALQTAEIALADARAEATRERMAKAAKYAEIGTTVISAPLTLFFPALGPVLAGIAGLIGLTRNALTKKEA